MDDPRIEGLARRVRWFDRYRRRLSVSIAGACTILGWMFLPSLAGADWPDVHARLMAIAGGVVLFFAIEVGLAWTIAIWETRHDQLIRDRHKLPRAEVVRRT